MQLQKFGQDFLHHLEAVLSPKIQSSKLTLAGGRVDKNLPSSAGICLMGSIFTGPGAAWAVWLGLNCGDRLCAYIPGCEVSESLLSRSALLDDIYQGARLPVDCIAGEGGR